MEEMIEKRVDFLTTDYPEEAQKSSTFVPLSKMCEMRKYCLSLLLLLLTLVSNAVEPPKREIRGVWLTTVYGLDWPHNPATTETGRKAQQRDVCDILDRLQDANFNTAFFAGPYAWRCHLAFGY